MINFRLPIRGTNDSITRPVSIGVLNDIKEILYINKDIRAKLSNEIDSYITNEQWDPIKLSSNSPRLEDIQFSANETVNQDTLITTSTNYNEYKAVLHDKEVNAFIRPIYVESEIEFNIKFRTKSKSNANNFINMLKLNLADNETMTLHNIEYMFYIPPEILELFLDIARLEDNINEEHIGYEDYLIKNSDGRMSLVGGLDGNVKNMNIVIKEKQLDVVGHFEDSISDLKGEYQDSTGTWEADITYKLAYNKPIALFISYPPLIYNQLLPRKYLILKDRTLGSNNLSKSKTYTNEENEPFNNGLRLDAMRDRKVNTTEFINIPNFDSFKPSNKQPYLIPVFSLLLSIDNEDKRSLFNLREIPEYKLHDSFMEFIEAREWKFICSRYDSIFYLTILENESVMDDGSIVMDSNLNVSATLDLDLKKTYRVMFHILTDLSVASPKSALRLNNYKETFNTALEALSIRNECKDNMLSKDEKTMLYNVKGNNPPYTVMVSKILAFKR